MIGGRLLHYIRPLRRRWGSTEGSAEGSTKGSRGWSLLRGSAGQHDRGRAAQGSRTREPLGLWCLTLQHMDMNFFFFFQTTQAAFPNGPQSGPSGAHLVPNFAQLGPNRGPHGMLLGQGLKTSCTWITIYFFFLPPTFIFFFKPRRPRTTYTWLFFFFFFLSPKPLSQERLCYFFFFQTKET